MGSRSRRIVALAAVLALACVVTPAAAAGRGAAPLTRTARLSAMRLRAASLGSSSATYTPDRWDSADDTITGARNLTARVTGISAPNGFGKASYDETHTFSVASNETTFGANNMQGDQDWFRFDVSHNDALIGMPYLIEAKTLDADVYPVIEVYGPVDDTSSVTPAGPETLVGPDGVGTIDPAARGSETGTWYAGYGASLTLVSPLEGHYFVRVRPKFDPPPVAAPPTPRGYGDGAGRYVFRLKVGQVTRLAGTNRIDTGVRASFERYADGELPLGDNSNGGSGSVVVATGYNFADALAGASLAGAVNGPVLLTHQDYLDKSVRDEIVRLGAHRVFLLGGLTALDNNVRDALAHIPGIGYTGVIRVAGTTRVETAVDIARHVNTEHGLPKIAFIANGWSFPDALAASPMAAYNVAPILLTTKDALSSVTAAALSEFGITDVVILGGPGAVGTGVENSLKTRLGTAHVLRVGGANRYETATKIAIWATGDFASDLTSTSVGTVSDKELLPLDWRGIGVTAGFNYADALGGGPMCGLSGHPLLLTPAGSAPTPWLFNGTGKALASYLSTNPASVNFVGKLQRSYVFGGPTVVSAGVMTTLDLLSGVSP